MLFLPSTTYDDFVVQKELDTSGVFWILCINFDILFVNSKINVPISLHSKYNPSYVVFGIEHPRDYSSSTKRDGIPISVFIPHSEYRYGSIRHDIALIRLARPVQYSNRVRPACFSTSSYESYVYQTCRAVGFGSESGVNRKYCPIHNLIRVLFQDLHFSSSFVKFSSKFYVT